MTVACLGHQMKLRRYPVNTTKPNSIPVTRIAETFKTNVDMFKNGLLQISNKFAKFSPTKREPAMFKSQPNVWSGVWEGIGLAGVFCIFSKRVCIFSKRL